MNRKAFRPTVVMFAATALATAGVAVTALPAAAAGGISSFTLAEPNVDFGDGNLNVWGNPSQNGELSWVNNAASRDVTLSGKLFINNSAFTCARMSVEYKNLVGTVLETDNGGTVCALDNGSHAWTVNLQENVSSSADKAVVKLQVQIGGGYLTLASKSVNL
jgi:hypothetical protein